MSKTKIIELMFASIVGGLISPFIVSWLQHKCIWKNQKRLETKYTIFSDAVKALAQYSTDALDFKLQKEKSSYQGVQKLVEARPETFALMEKSRGMVKAFFSEVTSNSFSKALNTKISIKNVPNLEFTKNQNEAIILMSEELGLK